MQTEIKSFVATGGAAFLAAKYVFDASNRKSLLYGIAAGLGIVALLQMKVPVPMVSRPVVDKRNSDIVNGVDNSKINTPENLSPINFRTGKSLNGQVSSQLAPEAVNDWDMAWGDNPYKNQNPTIWGV